MEVLGSLIFACPGALRGEEGRILGIPKEPSSLMFAVKRAMFWRVVQHMPPAEETVRG
jgi:hypothetical protein